MEQQQQQQQQQLRNEACLHSCAGKLIHSNHRLMATYVQLMPALVQRRMADYEAASAVPRAAAEQLETSPSGSSPSANLGKGGAG
uniref:Translocase of inner mitochondrial membrane 10B n=1 Tax=Ovis aries TaxID=9940 RepID=A0AC11CWR7_SHEEP